MRWKLCGTSEKRLWKSHRQWTAVYQGEFFSCVLSRAPSSSLSWWNGSWTYKLRVISCLTSKCTALTFPCTWWGRGVSCKREHEAVRWCRMALELRVLQWWLKDLCLCPGGTCCASSAQVRHARGWKDPGSEGVRTARGFHTGAAVRTLLMFQFGAKPDRLALQVCSRDLLWQRRACRRDKAFSVAQPKPISDVIECDLNLRRFIFVLSLKNIPVLCLTFSLAPAFHCGKYLF